ALLLTFGDTGLSAPGVIDWARKALPALEILPLVRAGHHAPEDAPEEISRAIRSWLGRHGW
ncbi:MAG TPA: haloalkane dehalogenase, partial [Aggregicoccus sp.]|nr:haloalkane dehalogenase [Aggregicoccus sp.]